MFGIKSKTSTDIDIKLATRQQLLNAISAYLTEQLKQYKVDPEVLWADRANITIDTLQQKVGFAVEIEEIQQYLALQISQKVVVTDVPLFVAQDYWYIYSLINVALQDAVLKYLHYTALQSV